MLTWFPSHEKAPRAINPEHALRQTEEYWTGWAKRCHAQGPWREAVVRSLITLKGLTYAPTGGIVAAATTSLPEEIGGVRNWDYRYCWLRDATFTLDRADRSRLPGRSAFLARMAFARGRGERGANADHVWRAGRASSGGIRDRLAERLRELAAGSRRKRRLEAISAGCLWRSARLDVSRTRRRDRNE